MNKMPVITCVCMLSCFSSVQLFVTLWTVACQAPLSLGFSRQEHWSGLRCLSPGDLPDPGIEPVSPVAPALQADLLLLSHQGSPITCLSKIALNVNRTNSPIKRHRMAEWIKKTKPIDMLPTIDSF